MCTESLDLPSPAVLDTEAFGSGGQAADFAGPIDVTKTACIDPRELATADNACPEMLALDQDERGDVYHEGGNGLEKGKGPQGKRKASSSPSAWGDEVEKRPIKRCKH